MLNLGAPELLVILVVGLLVLGPARLPQAARQVGQAVGELRRVSSGFQAELRDAMNESPRPASDRPDRPRRTEPLRAVPAETSTETAA